MTPPLRVVGTPIGNLGDISPRAVEVLGAAEVIACEDTRRTGKLLSHLGIGRPQLVVLNDHTEGQVAQHLVGRVREGKAVVLVSDAGMPGVSDPGHLLVRSVLDAGLRVEVVPGPSAVLVALVASGLPTDRFIFEGFVPRKGAERSRRLRAVAEADRTTVVFEAPHRIARTLGELAQVAEPTRRVVIARELTKMHEEIWRTTLGEAAAVATMAEPRGEHVVVLDAAPEVGIDDALLRSELEALISGGSTRRDAVDVVAGRYGVARRRVYGLALTSAAVTHRPAPTIEVLGIGNALVDVLSQEADETVERLGMTKGAMDLVDEPRMAEVYDAMGPGTEVSGGSAANTMAGIASLGGVCHYIGRVRDDQLGRVFVHDIRSLGVGYSTAPAEDGPATGCCLILVTPDAQRTMNTFLGASALLSADEIDTSVVEAAGLVFLEGYLFDRPEAQAAFEQAALVAHEAGRKVSLTLSDLFCVERHRAAFRRLVAGHVDVLFANEAEILGLYEVPDVDAAIEAVRRDCPLSVITRSERGAVVVTADEVVSVPAFPVDEVVDTTGAGDQFAAGFLFGLSRGEPFRRCAELGALAAAEVISHLGPRPHVSLAELVARESETDDL